MGTNREPRAAAQGSETGVSPEARRRPYTSPSITELGKLATLTLGSGTWPADAPLGSSG